MEFRKFEKNDFVGLSQVMYETWNFQKEFPDLKDDKLIYRLFLEECLIKTEYAQVVVDEENRVVGALLGRIHKKKKFSPKVLWSYTKYFFKLGHYFLFNYFGKKKEVIKTLTQYLNTFEQLENDAKYFDSTVELLVLSSKARGHGLGRRLVDNFVKYCKTNHAKSVYLFTDRGCTYQFYDKYGFDRYKSIHSPVLAEPEAETNGFVYTYKIKEG